MAVSIGVGKVNPSTRRLGAVRRGILGAKAQGGLGVPRGFKFLASCRWLALVSLLLVLPEVCWAAPTKLISYQGRITDSNGQPLANATYSVRFRLFTNLTDCNADTPVTDPPLRWTETQASVQVTNGLFSVVLGTVTPLAGTFDEDLWLQVKVAANPVFTPCDRLTTAPFSIRSIDTNTAANAKECTADATCETTAVQINSTSTVLTQGTGNSTRVTTNSGYVEIGPQNASWSHFMTDRTQFYFNKQVGVDGDLFPYTNNTRALGTSGNRWATTYSVNGDFSGNMTITGGTTTLNNAASNLINFGSVGVAPPSAAGAGWKVKTYGSNYGLGIDSSTQWFSTGQYYKFYNSDGSTYWKNRLTLDTSNAITYPAVYAYDNAATPVATLLEFKTGMYNNGGTFYSQNQMYSRTGLANDSASTSGYLNLNDDVLVSGGGWLRVDGAEGIYFESYGGGWNMSDSTWIRAYGGAGNRNVYTPEVMRADGGFQVSGTNTCTMVDIPDVSSGAQDTQCAVGWKAVAYYSRGTGDYCGGGRSSGAAWWDGYIRGYGAGHAPNQVGANLNAGDNCFYGNMLCCWAS